MGLPLYQAPVESDIKGKPTPRSPPTRARSTIRRTRRHIVPGRPPRHRLSPLSGWISSDAAERAPPARGELDMPARLARELESPGADDHIERVRFLRDMVGQFGTPNDRERTSAMFGTRFAALYAGTNPRSSSGASTPNDARDSRSPAPGNEPSRSSLRDMAPRIPRDARPRDPRSRDTRLFRQAADTISLPPHLHGRAVRVLLETTDPRVEVDDVAEPDSFADLDTDMLTDGLGDRNRSLSPEGDNAWDTLLSSITPDPQPPSVGSSFASNTAASAAASQNTSATSSSRTSLTGRTESAEESLEQPCESGCENSDTEGDEDEDVPENPLTRFPAARRSYADVTRGEAGGADDEDPLEALGGRLAVQHILRTLSRRDDLPDEWWAGVGLSRRLSDEPSN